MCSNLWGCHLLHVYTEPRHENVTLLCIPSLVGYSESGVVGNLSLPLLLASARDNWDSVFCLPEEWFKYKLGRKVKTSLWTWEHEIWCLHIEPMTWLLQQFAWAHFTWILGWRRLSCSLFFLLYCDLAWNHFILYFTAVKQMWRYIWHSLRPVLLLCSVPVGGPVPPPGNTMFSTFLLVC